MKMMEKVSAHFVDLTNIVGSVMCQLQKGGFAEDSTVLCHTELFKSIQFESFVSVGLFSCFCFLVFFVMPIF